MDIKIFMDTALDICLLRRLNRDIIERGRTLEASWPNITPQCAPYFQFIEPSKHADLIVPASENRIAIEVIKAKTEMLQTESSPSRIKKANLLLSFMSKHISYYQ